MLRVLVSGGSRGIGRAIVERLAGAGYAIDFLYRENETAARATVEKVRATGGTVTSHRCDVTHAESVENLLDRIEGKPWYGLINNAAVLRDGHFLLMEPARWDVVLDTTLTAAYRLTRHVLRSMVLAGQGRIVNIGSLSGILGQAGQTNYAAAKGGLHAFSRALAREVGRYAVTVNTVVPGWTDTELVAASLSPARRAKAVRDVPLGRFGTPDDVAAAVEFMLSAGASYITGATVRVDGGLGC